MNRRGGDRGRRGGQGEGRIREEEGKGEEEVKPEKAWTMRRVKIEELEGHIKGRSSI